MTKIALVNGRIIDPARGLDEVTNLYLAQGKIQAIAPDMPDFKADIVVDARRMIVAPGIVDLNANLLRSQSGLSSFARYAELAPKCGITSFATLAATKDRCLEPTEITALSKHVNASAKAYFIGPLTQNLQGKQLAELMLLRQSGCVAFSNGLAPILNSLIKHRCYDYAAMLALKLIVIPRDPFLSDYGCMHQGQVSTRLGLPAIPTLAETLALGQELLQIETSGVVAHIGRLSSVDSVLKLHVEQEKGLLVTADAAIHQFYLTDVDVQLENGFCHVQPPLRSAADKTGLRDGIKKGVISVITSDHVMLSSEVKALPFQDTEPGIASWPVLLPLTLRLAKEETIPLMTALATITSNPAKILGIDAGHLTIGAPADVMVFDPEEHWSLDAAELAAFGCNTPFANWQLQGRVKYTVVAGQVVR
jgi:dihydroorotase